MAHSSKKVFLRQGTSTSSAWSNCEPGSLEELLIELYDHCSPLHYNFDTETYTEASILSDCYFSSSANTGRKHSFSKRFDLAQLQQLDSEELTKVVCELQKTTNETSLRLVRQLRRRDQQLSKRQARCNLMTAILQAMSPKRRIDSNLQFTIDPLATDTGYDDWLKGMQWVARLPDGMPYEFRKKLWLTIADQYFTESGIDWPEVKLIAFNDRLNPDDHKIGEQIIKDLHRTGWSNCEGEKERVLLKRVLLGYARYNKTIGYCQGFNVIAALILEVTEFKECDALKVMILLIEKVLPNGYFGQTLHALSVDMAVLRDLIKERLPRLSEHLDKLQNESECKYEPILTNVFSMQWFLTLFATSLPKHTVFRVWDSLMLEGSEILIRTAIVIWYTISRRVFKAKTADEFYMVMGLLSTELLEMSPEHANKLIKQMYDYADLPDPKIGELRDRYQWNIQPHSSTFGLFKTQVQQILQVSDAEDQSCVPNIGDKLCGTVNNCQEQSRSTPDLPSLQKQYKHLKQRQKQAAVILQNAYSKGQRRVVSKMHGGDYSALNPDEVFNHLYNFNDSPRKVVHVGALDGIIPLTSRRVQPESRTKESPHAPNPASSRRLGEKSSRSRITSADLGSAQHALKRQSTSTLRKQDSDASQRHTINMIDSPPGDSSCGLMDDLLSFEKHVTPFGMEEYDYGSAGRMSIRTNRVSARRQQFSFAGFRHRRTHSIDLGSFHLESDDSDYFEEFSANNGLSPCLAACYARRANSCIDLRAPFKRNVIHKTVSARSHGNNESVGAQNTSPPPRPPPPVFNTPDSGYGGLTWNTPRSWNYSVIPTTMKTSGILGSRNEVGDGQQSPFEFLAKPQRHSSVQQMTKSKNLLDKIAEREEKLAKKQASYNPFPVQYKSKLIEREKRLGLIH